MYVVPIQFCCVFLLLVHESSTCSHVSVYDELQLGAQLLSCSHLVDHTSILFIFHVNLIGQRSFWGMKHGIFLCIPALNYYNGNIWDNSWPIFSLKYITLHVSRSYRLIPYLTSKIVHENSTQPTLSEYTQTEGSYLISDEQWAVSGEQYDMNMTLL